MIVDTEAMNTCYGLMGLLDPKKWLIETDGAKTVIVRLARIGSSDYLIKFKGSDNITICKVNCVGKVVAADTIKNSLMSPRDFRQCLKEVWGDDVFIPEFTNTK